MPCESRSASRGLTPTLSQLYFATRHFARWYMLDFLALDSEDVAIALGHTDGGDLVHTLYADRDRTASASASPTSNMRLCGSAPAGRP